VLFILWSGQMAHPFQNITVREITTFAGKFPSVETFEWVDTELLHEGDEKPFYVTLRVAEYPRVSANGLRYDDELVSAIEEQIRGRVGIRGHIPPEHESTSYPLGEVFWVGCLREGNVLYAKCYVPPGATRNDIKRRIAIGGGVGTSIYGLAEQEVQPDGTWSAREFVLKKIDLTEPEDAALDMGGQVVITAEQKKIEDEPDNKETDMSDTPETTVTTGTLTNQQGGQNVISETAHRQVVGVLESKITTLETRIQEMGDVTATVKLAIPDGADPLERITAMTEFLAGLQGAFGQDVSVEMLTNMKAEGEAAAASADALDAETFEADMEKEVGTYMETWNVTTDRGKSAIDSIRKSLKRRALSEIGDKRDDSGKRDRASLKDVVSRLWEEEYKSLAEMARDSASGGRAYVASVDNKKEKPKLATREEAETARASLGF
jgi:hypothetical protein